MPGDKEAKVALDRACTAHGPPTESAHCLNMDTRGKENHRRRNIEGERQKIGFAAFAT